MILAISIICFTAVRLLSCRKAPRHILWRLVCLADELTGAAKCSDPACRHDGIGHESVLADWTLLHPQKHIDDFSKQPLDATRHIRFTNVRPATGSPQNHMTNAYTTA